MKSYVARFSALLTVAALALPGPVAQGGVVKGVENSVGELVLSFNNLGYVGNPGFIYGRTYASCEYPRHSRIEHWLIAGLWVGARDAGGEVHVSASADDVAAASLTEFEFSPRFEDGFLRLSNDPQRLSYSPRALADEHLEFACDDLHGSGEADSDHVPLGVRVHARVLVYAESNRDDFVLIDYRIENIGDEPLGELYLGWYQEFTIGSTQGFLDPDFRWDFYDDISGFYGPGDVPSDPDLRLAFAMDPDQDEGAAPSWIGVCLLDTGEPAPLRSYRQWHWHGDGWPETDKDKFQAMASGQIDVGEAFMEPSNWCSMFAAGPWNSLPPGDSIRFAVAVVAGADRTELLEHAQTAQDTFGSLVPTDVRSSTVGSLKSRYAPD